MGLRDKLYQLASNLILERPVQDKKLAELREELEASGREAQQLLAVAGDLQENRETLRHVIGIERWGQRRLQVALGEPLLMDESDKYFPVEHAGWDKLRQTFQETRQETVTLVCKLEEVDVSRDLTIPHNQWGDLSVNGWLNYLNGHASRDVKRIK